MTNHHEVLAKQVVTRFAQSLDAETRARITPARFEDLEQSIRKLLAHEHNHIADLLDAVTRSLRDGCDKPELEL